MSVEKGLGDGTLASMDRDKVNARMVAEFGHALTSTKYVYRWRPHPRLDVVTERRPGREGVCWMPWPGGDATTLQNARRRPPGDRVNSNVYAHTPSMAEEDLLEVRIADEAQMHALIGYIRGRVDALGAIDA